MWRLSLNANSADTRFTSIANIARENHLEFVLPGNEPEENYFNKLQDDIKMSSSVHYCTINVVFIMVFLAILAMEVNLVSAALIVTANPEMALPVILKKT